MEADYTKTQRDCLSKTRMEDFGGDLLIQRDAVLPELCCNHFTITNLVEVLSNLMAFTDPQEGKLTQSQEKAVNSLVVLKPIFAAVPGPTSKTSVE